MDLCFLYYLEYQKTSDVLMGLKDHLHEANVDLNSSEYEDCHSFMN